MSFTRNKNNSVLIKILFQDINFQTLIYFVNKIKVN